MKRWLMKYLCCCCAGGEDDDTGPSRTYVPPPPLTPEEAEAIRQRNAERERVRREEAERLEAERERSPAELHYEEFPALEGVRTTIHADAETAVERLTGGSSARMVNGLLEKIGDSVPTKDNLEVDVKIVDGKLQLGVRIKDDTADPTIPQTWRTKNCEVSLGAHIETPEEGDPYFYIDRLDARSGNCKPFFCGLLPMVEAMGLKEIRLEATEVGGYAWIRYGFRPVKEGKKTWNDLRMAALEYLDAAEEEIANPDVVEEARRYLENPQPDSIVGVANIKHPLRGKTLGFRLVTATMWNGVFRLDNPEALAIVKDYIGLDT